MLESIQPPALHEALAEHFSLDELKLLCHDAGIDPESVPYGERGKNVYAFCIVGAFRRMDRLSALLGECDHARPGVKWADYRVEATVPAEWSELFMPQNLVNTQGGAAFIGTFSVTGDIVGRDKITITEETAYIVAGLPNPYLGLRPFTYADRDAYAGRAHAVEEAVTQLTAPGQQRTILFVTGASGSGKSSFAQAGLLPALEEHYAARGQRVRRAVFRPGAHPKAALEDARSQLTATQSGTTPVDVIVVDQFEELFTQSQLDERETLFAWLTGLPAFDQCQTHVVATLRSDYLKELFDAKLVWDIAKRDGIELRAMTVNELKDAIQRPLQAKAERDSAYQSKRFDPALVDKLANDAAESPTLLPLLQVTLEELWKRGRLILANYGLLTDAIRQRAEQVYAFEDYDAVNPSRPRTPEAQQALLATFLDLVRVSLDEDYRRDVRVARPEESLTRERRRLAEDLARARLLSVSVENNVEVVNIVHESLITNWERLRTAVSQQRLQLQRRARFTQDLQDWLANGKSDAYLLKDLGLARAQELDRLGDVELADSDARELLQRSSAAAEAEQQRRLREAEERAEADHARVRIQRFALAGLSVLLLLAVLATVFAVTAQRRAASSEQAALQQEKIAGALAMAAQAENVVSFDPQLSLILAVSASNTLSNTPAEQALHTALTASHVRLIARGHVSAVISVAYSPDGARLLSTSEDGTARVWDAATGNATLVLRSQMGEVVDAAFSPDGKLIATGGSDGLVRVWDANTGQVLFSLAGHTATVRSVAFDRVGARLISAGDGGTARIWDLAQRRAVHVLSNPNGELFNSAAFNPDGDLIVTAAWDGLQLWSADTGAPDRAPLTKDHLGSAAFSPDGQRIVATDVFGFRADVWDVKSRTLLGSLAGQHTWVVRRAAFSPDGNYVVTTGGDKQAVVWDVSSANPANWFPVVTLRGHTEYVADAAFSPDGTRLATAGDNTVRVWDTQPDGEQFVLGGAGVFAGRSAFSPDGKLLGAMDYGEHGRVSVFDAETGKLLSTFEVPWVNNIAFSPDGKRVATVDAYANAYLQLWDWAQQAPLFTVSIGSLGRGVSFSPDGKWLAVSGGNTDGTPPFAAIRDASTGVVVRPLAGPTSWVASIHFSPDGQLVIASDAGGYVYLWNAATGGALRTILIGGGVGDARFSHDGRWIVAANTDQVARLIDVNTWQVVREFKGHEAEVTDVAISDDGRTLATASRDHTVRLWDVATGRERSVLYGAHDNILTVDFAPGGRRVMASSDDGYTRLYLVNFDDLRALARARELREMTCDERARYLNEQAGCAAQ